MRLFLPILLALAAPCFGQEIKLEGPDRVNAGDPVSLIGNVPEGVGESYRWTVIPAPPIPPMELTDRAGKPVLIILKSAGTSYTILLDCQIPKDGPDPWYRGQKVVQVGNGPGPDPDPDPDPEPDNDLTAKVKTWLSTVNSPRKATETQAISELYLTLASKVAAGGITDEDALADEMTQGHATSLGANARHWFGFIQSFGNTVNAAAGIKEKGRVFESVGNALKGL